MAEVDYNALDASSKGLVVIFIVSIFCVNILLIFKIVRKRGFMYQQQSMILISMATADIVLALFGLVAKAVTIFNDLFFVTSCDLYKSSEVYSSYLIHFVFSVGLTLMSMDLVLRYKYQHTSSINTRKTMKTVFFSALPWILGLVIVLPLTMAGTTDSDSVDPMPMPCFEKATQQRYLAMGLVSVLIPVALAVIVTFVVMCMNVPSPAPQTLSNTNNSPLVEAPFSITAPHYSPLKTETPGEENPSMSNLVIFVTAFIFSLCVTPLAIVEILEQYYYTPFNRVLYWSFLWLSVSRSLITPLIFIRYFKK